MDELQAMIDRVYETDYEGGTLNQLRDDVMTVVEAIADRIKSAENPPPREGE